ncbi:MAG: sulfatase-like hydrolase/transferase [Planctomycetes bacterium]|nr:sulfatase-like hydrolase/transferase [Planctomycetota bacterium]
MDRPNILLITTDQQRFDAMSLNGNPLLRTPIMDNLAARGTNFTRAYTTCPSCIAARRTILTGQAPATHGLVGYSETDPFDPKYTLPGLLADAGYQTQLVGKLHQQPMRRRFGFDHMIMSLSPAARPDSEWTRHNDYADWYRLQTGGRDPQWHGIHGNGRIARAWPEDDYLHHSTWLTTEAIRFLTQTRDPSCPFFLHLSYWAPHPPLIPPAFYFERYQRLRDQWHPELGDWCPKNATVKPGVAHESPTGPYGLEEMRDAMAGYFGLINHIDDQIQRLLDSYFVYMGPRSKDPVYILFTSDHGEMLGDHHLFRKSLGYEGSAHVPFFIGGRNVPLAGKPSDALVCLEDLLPTCCEMAGVEIPADAKVDGKSLMPVVRGEKSSVRDELHGEHSGGHANHFVVHGKHKYIWYSGTNEEQLFDLEADPRECHDLSGNAALLKPLREHLAARIKGREDYAYDIAKLKPLCNRQPGVFKWKT